MTDFGMAAKVRPAVLLTGNPATDELDLVTVLLHTTAVRGNRWGSTFLSHSCGREHFIYSKFKAFRP